LTITVIFDGTHLQSRDQLLMTHTLDPTVQVGGIRKILMHTVTLWWLPRASGNLASIWS